MRRTQQQPKADLWTTGLPAAPDLEALVLGAALADANENLPAVLAALTPDDFSIEAHRRIYRAIGDVHEPGGQVDRITVHQRLVEQGLAESVGGMSALVSLDDGLPRVYGLDSYIRTVADKATLRRTILACQSVAQRCLLAQDSPQDVLAEAERTLAALGERAPVQARLRPVGDIFADGGIDRILSPPREDSIPYPWPSLNRVLTGMRPGQLLVPAARPAVGKSAMASAIAIHAARAGVGVALFSLEMSASEILQRAACGIAGVDAQRARQGALSQTERNQLQRAAADLAELPFYIDDTTGATVSAVSLAIRRLRASVSVGLVVIDYLQLMDGAGRYENRNAAIGEISRGLKRMAREFKVPVVALSQLNRETEKQQRRPILSDLRDSGAIEQDADVVLFLHQPERDYTAPVIETEVIVAKHRAGPVGKVMLAFNRRYCRFEERAER